MDDGDRENLAETLMELIDELAGTRRAAKIADLVEIAPHGARQREVHRALLDLHRAGRVHLEPEPFGHRVDARAAESAIHLGGEDRHLVMLRR